MEDELRNDVSTRQQSITVQDLRDNRLAEGSKKGYLSGVRQVVPWLRESGRSGTKNPDGSINLDILATDQPSRTTTAGKMWPFRLVSSLMPLQSIKTQTGTIKPGGKQPLRYHQYQELCRASLTKLGAGFTHLFLTLSWNLMCRSRSTENVRVDHLSDEGDSIDNVASAPYPSGDYCFERLPAVVITSNRIRVHHDEALCILLGRLAFPVRFHTMSRTFGRSRSSLCEIFLHVVNYLYERWGSLLFFKKQKNINRYCAAVASKGAPLSNVFGFIDGT
ncbi:hypothetical protein H257_12326 [Aphanomyces astaci]|uniref:DDE Tnp4 domain-containing protein n=1 Tax=Aphanomyces astaci TaxID=112090 RepID=W4FYL2_APHAT|nr:hypothetical protein H257_12326 [Aphanomyces astaci]ETV72560.1 hypothetical protein H257_12326 [Aphanomyces astaci]|eukprot:XP_009837788.1 hypothetical protein H257_12326 [Aphanomyces astaci]